MSPCGSFRKLFRDFTACFHSEFHQSGQVNMILISHIKSGPLLKNVEPNCDNITSNPEIL